MNKDKLKKEVRDYLRQQFGPNGGGIVTCNLEELLLHFAEPREKRIVELEKENADLKKESDFYHAEKGEYKSAFLKEVLEKNK